MVQVTLEIQLKEIWESSEDEINDIIRLKIDESSIDDYPATGTHQFYTESFEYKDYGYNISINMFFNMERFGEVDCCKDSLFFGVTPCHASLPLCNEAKRYYKKSNFLCFSQHIGKNNADDIVTNTHSRVKNQIDTLLEIREAAIAVVHKTK